MIEKINLTDKEIYWFEVISKDRSILDKMERERVLDKAAIKMTRSFIDFMDLIMKYNNLNFGQNFEKTKRLIRSKRSIPTTLLDYNNYEYVMFNGLYIVTDVVFIDKPICLKFFKEPTPENKTIMGIPQELECHTIQYLDSALGVGLCKSSIIDDYIRFQAHWSYPVL